MYTIHADGKLLFDNLSEDVSTIALSPKLQLDIEKAGSISFVLPPGNRMHGKLNKLKSILTVEQDGEHLARGRVMESTGDYYNQQSIYCEGDRAFLLDSMQEPYSYSGTVHGLFRQFVAKHNAMVEADRQFTVGEITAVDSNETTEVESTLWASTSSEIEDHLLNVYGGYLRTRTVGSTHYLDWVKQYGDENTQPIEFSVNMLDLTDKVDAGDVFTVLVPLGASEIGDDGEYTDPLSIASVNNGLNYIQDDEAVAKYGKIWRTHTWSYEDDPAKLLEKAREYLKTGIALETLTLKAVDMHFVDGNVQPIRIGDKVRILSDPHGLDKVMVCTQIEIDLRNPENTVYTFGERPRTLTENVVMAEEEVNELTGYRGGGGGRKSVQEEVSDIIRWAKYEFNEKEGEINFWAGETDKLGTYVNAAVVRIDGAEAEIELAASRLDNVENRTTSVELVLNGTEATAGLVASVTEHGERISSAELRLDGAEGEIELKVSKDGVISSINQTAEEIKISASKINLQGYVTASQLEAEVADLNINLANTVATDTLEASSAIIAYMTYQDEYCTWKSKTVQTSIPSFTTATITDANGNSRTVVTGWADAPSNYRSTMYYLSHS